MSRLELTDRGTAKRYMRAHDDGKVEAAKPNAVIMARACGRTEETEKNHGNE